jgi:hypothetical protein
MMCVVQYLCISTLVAQFTKMAANGSEKTFVCLHFIIVLMFVESQKVQIQSTCKVCNKPLECCYIK